MNEEVKKKAQGCLKQRFHILTGHEFPDNAKEIFKSPEDIVLSEDVKEFAGKTELFFGKGKNSVKDRLALQAILKQLTTSQEEDENATENYKKKIAATKDIVIYLPSKILHGGKEILEMPGTDDSDPMAMNFIREALETVHAVILVTEYSLKPSEIEVKEMLSNSGFIKRFLKSPNDCKLMLLTYPEKNLGFQFGKTDETKIKKMEQRGIDNRKAELNTMKENIFKRDSLPQDVAQSIITLDILPVLHTSILSQQGVEHQVLTDNNKFLQYTGIKSLIDHLDGYVASQHKSTFMKIETQLSHFQQEIPDGMGTNDAKLIIQLQSKREFKNIHDPQVNKANQSIANSLRKGIHNSLCNLVTDKVKEIMTKNIETAKERWNEDKKKVKSISVYNPYFYGKNPSPKVRLYNTFFEELETEQANLSRFIRNVIKDRLQEYKKQTISQCTNDLNKLLRNLDLDPISSDFVQNIIENPLDDALAWYKGKKRLPFNKKKIEEMFQESQRQSLRKYILEPSFKNNSVKHAEIQTMKNIEKCMLKVEDYFIGKLLNRHDDRWKSLRSKLFMPNGSSKFWLQLIQHIKMIAKDQESYNHKEKIAELNAMMKVNFT